jgi:hypothetical protein
VSDRRTYVFVAADKMLAAFKNDSEVGWKEFYKSYPGANGLTYLSAVGFDSQKATAVVNIQHVCGPLCGFGSLIVLRKVGAKWHEVDGTFICDSIAGGCEAPVNALEERHPLAGD